MDASESHFTNESTKMSEENTIIEKGEIEKISEEPQMKSDIQEENDKINSQYVYNCVGSAYGCTEKTNGSQYCSKYYCPYEEIM